MNAYHFVGKTLRDGSPIPKNGVWLKHRGPLVMCQSGFHASRHPFDALQYAPGTTLCKVKVRGDIDEQDDKLVGRERLIVARIDATEMLRRFARLCALDVIDKWDAPEIVVRYLKTGDEKIMAAAWAARDAARAAAWDAARAAAWAAENAAWAAENAAWAARDAARAAAWAAAWDAAWAAENAAWAARDAQRKRFARMVAAEFRRVA